LGGDARPAASRYHAPAASIARNRRYHQEELVARAKRTNRTEARRRHRAEQATLAETEPGDVIAAPAPTGKSSAKSATPERPGIKMAFRGAMRPLDLRGDLRALPTVLVNWGFLAAMGITVGAAALFVIAYSDAMAAIPVGTATPDQLTNVVGTSTIPYFLGTMALQPPPAIGAFLIGFAAKRASWLGGLIYGIFVTIVAIVVLQTQAGRLLTGDSSAQAVIVGHAAWSPLGAALFASAAAWYRRFLDLANPNRQAQQQARKGKQKPAR
jgi:hypothetical protein